jgi:Spy/CpxP family protein refolding chaperone
MRGSIISVVLLTAIAVGAAVPAVFAQQGPPAGQYDEIPALKNRPGRGNILSDEKREEIRKKIETVRIWRLTEELKLDTTTSAKLASLMSSIDEQRKGLIQTQMMSMRELRSTLKSQKPDEAKIKSLLVNLEGNQRALQELRERQWKGLQDILTIEQQARFLLFQQAFRHEIQSMIANARGRGRGRGPMGGQGRGNGPGGPIGPLDEN